MTHAGQPFRLSPAEQAALPDYRISSRDDLEMAFATLRWTMLAYADFTKDATLRHTVEQSGAWPPATGLRCPCCAGKGVRR